MGKFVDLTGQVFSRLTVISRAESKQGQSYWNCLCQCGSETIVQVSSLKSGGTKSCGCQRIIDLTNQVFGLLTVKSFAGQGKEGAALWSCLCQCGAAAVVRSNDLRGGHTRSCGCLQSKVSPITTHGMTGTPEYHAWQNMKNRCLNPKNKRYASYGGRGITVCDRWLESFENFYEDMGPRPSPEHSIDRKENDGNYEPDNCHWATGHEQSNNTRRNRCLTIGDVTMTVAQWARQEKISDRTLRSRLNKGWSDYDAVMIPTERERAS